MNDTHVKILTILAIIAIADIAISIIKLICISIADTYYMSRALFMGASAEEVKELQERRSKARQEKRQEKNLFSKLKKKQKDKN